MSKKYVLIVTLALLAASAAASGVRSWLAPVAAGAPIPADRRDTESHVEAELIALTPRGCEPREITRPRGRFLLSVHNRTGRSITALEVGTEDGARVYDLPGRARRLSWAKLIDPPAGRYVLRVAEHPDLACRITITDQ